MRRPSIFHSRRQVMELKMTSLIDVVFLLLIFFVWTASFRIAEYVLPSSVSEAGTATAGSARLPPPPEADFADVVVRVLWRDGQPSWQINKEVLLQRSDVQTKLSRIFAVLRDAPVVIHPDGDVPLGHVIDLYDMARVVGFSTVQFAASAEPQRG
jgi:biopolymer transport protein ExbD